MVPYTPVMTAKILVIEDSPEVRMSFVNAFEDEGYEVYSASDGRSGLDQFVKHAPDLVLTDLRMPDIDGMTVLSQIRKSSNVPVIVVTAIADAQTKEACLTAGADDYIVKGSGVDDLVWRAQKQLDRAN